MKNISYFFIILFSFNFPNFIDLNSMADQEIIYHLGYLLKNNHFFIFYFSKKFTRISMHFF